MTDAKLSVPTESRGEQPQVKYCGRGHEYTSESTLIRSNGVRLCKLCFKPRRTHCAKGHELTDENSYIDPKRGRRSCRICKDATNKAYALTNPGSVRACQKTYREAHPDRCRANDRLSRVKRTYGLTSEAHAELVSKGCSICGGFNSDGTHLSIDHDHACCPGKKSCGECVRGALCDVHNMALGLFKDNIQHLRGAIAYLQGNSLGELNDAAV
jgi:hypothetical protein